MLGVASERAFTVLAETFVVARADDAGQLAGLIENPRTSYNARSREFRKRLEPLRSALSPDLVDVLTLDAIADLLRVTRNAAGDPTGQDVDEDTARAHLQITAVYLRRMTALQAHLPTGRRAGP